LVGSRPRLGVELLGKFRARLPASIIATGAADSRAGEVRCPARSAANDAATGLALVK
jgi:hypothetical protein